MRDSAIFYSSFYEAIKELPEKNQVEIYNAIFDLSFKGIETELSGISKTVFILIKPKIDHASKALDRSCSEYRKWRIGVFTRDDYLCQHCFSEENLHAHHIESFALVPKLRFDVNNGLTLCNDCHKKVHSK